MNTKLFLIFALLSCASLSASSQPAANDISVGGVLSEEDRARRETAVVEACKPLNASAELAAQQILHRVISIVEALTKKNMHLVLQFPQVLQTQIVGFKVPLQDVMIGERTLHAQLEALQSREPSDINRFLKAVIAVLAVQKRQQEIRGQTLQGDEVDEATAQVDQLAARYQNGRSSTHNNRLLMLAGCAGGLAVLALLGYFILGGSSKKNGKNETQS